MRLMDRHGLMAQPKGTLYLEDGTLRQLVDVIRGNDGEPIDWVLLRFGGPDASSTEELLAAQELLADGGSVHLNRTCEKDGSFDEFKEYLVLEPLDVAALLRAVVAADDATHHTILTGGRKP